MRHQPVLKNEVLECLEPKPGENFIDCTFGFGGHASEILKKIKPDGRVLGIEADEKEIEIIEKDGLDKNLLLVDGRPLSSYVINACKKSGVFDEIYLNSEHEIFKR